MIKSPEISASYSDALNKLLQAIKIEFNIDDPNKVLSVFNQFLNEGLPYDIKPSSYRILFPLYECFKYWMEVTTLISNNSKPKVN